MPTVPPLSRDPVAWLAFAATFALLGLGAAPVPGFLDAGELVAAARELGGIHPPGHPGWLSLAGLAELLPMGPYAWRVALLSSLFAGGSVLVAVRLARQLLADVTEPRAQALWAAVAAVVLVACGSLWQVGVRAEVYTLALLTNLWALEAAVRAGRAAQSQPGQPQPQPGQTQTQPQPALPQVLGPMAEAAAAVALGLLNHHYVTVFALPAVLVAGGPALGLVARQSRKWLLVLVFLAAVLGLAYLGLSLRALADTELRWGNPATWPGLWDTVTARHFQRSVTQAQVSVLDNTMVLLGMVTAALGGWLAAWGALGLAFGLLARGRGQWTRNLALWLALGGALLTKALMQIDTRNPDDHGYVLMAPAVLAVAAAQVGGVLFGSRGVWRTRPAEFQARASSLALVAALVLASLQIADFTKDPATWSANLRAPDLLDAHVRRTLAPGTLYLSSYYGLGFQEQAFRVAEGRRPDVTQAHLSFRTGDTDGGRAWQRWFARRHPEYAALAQGAGVLGRTPMGNVLKLAEERPIYAEQDPTTRIPSTSYGFDGLVHRLLTDPERALDYDLAELRRRHERIWDGLYARLTPADLQDQPTRAVLLWQHALQAAHALRRGWMEVAAVEIARARQLNPRDRTLDRLEQRLAALQAAWQRADTKGWQVLWQRYAGMDLDELVQGD